MKEIFSIKSILLFILAASSVSVFADIQKDPETLKRIEADEKQREIYGVYDIQDNTVSNIEFPTTNYGLFGYDVPNRVGGGNWPRGTPNQYIFGGGCWLGARKFPTERRSYKVFYAYDEDGETIDTTFFVPDRDSMGKYCAVTYNPRNARSFMVPGNVIDGLGVDPNQARKYRTYFSTDFNQQGEPFVATDGPNWPIWDTSDDPEDTLKYSRYFGFYVDDVQQRDMNNFPRGPAYISGEDIFATFKDTDLTAHDLGVAAAGLGYPLYLQTEITIYSWGFGRYQDFIFVKYNFVNVSEYRRDGLPADTLYDCYMAPIMDVDVARRPFTAAGAANDRVRYYGGSPGEDSTYNLAFQWTDGDRGEQGFGFGYLGFDFLESPATITRTRMQINPILNDQGQEIGKDTVFEVIDRPENNMVRKDRPFYPNSEQLGLETFQNWNIDEDRRTDEARYNFLSEGLLETDNGPGDKRFMMVTGPFNMRPGDSVRVVVGICLANTCLGSEATGETEDICELVALDEFMQSVYDNNFRAPLPPDQSRMYDVATVGVDTVYDDDGNPILNETSRGYNNAAKITWDATAELSEDDEEQGLDFLGYRIYRARRTDLDTFSLSLIEPGDQGYTSGAGLQGWKQIAQYELPLPFAKSQVHTVANGDPSAFSFQDSLRIVGPYRDAVTGKVDRNKVVVMRFPTRSYQVPMGQQMMNNEDYIPQIFAMDSTSNPWFPLFNDMGGPDVFGSSLEPTDILDPISDRDEPIMRDALLGYVDFKTSVVRFNPLYFKPVTQKLKKEQVDSLPDDGIVYFTVKTDSIWYDRDADNIRHYDTTEVTENDFWDEKLIDIIDGNGDTTFKYIVFRRVIYDQLTSDIKYIFDPASIKEEVEVEEITETDSIYVPDEDRWIYYEKVIEVITTPTGDYTLLSRYPLDDSEIGNVMKFANFDQIQETLDTIYSALEKGSSAAELNFPNFSGSDIVKERVITPYMDQITNGRTFYDIGDDDGDNQIDLSDDVRKTEKLINQVPYYYRVLAYDEGDVNTGSQRKLNSGKQVGSPNVVEVIPKPASTGEKLSFDIVEADSNLLGSLNSFDLFAVDADRAQQLFAGDTLQVTFAKVPQLNTVQYTNGRNQVTEREYGLYQTSITIDNLSKDEQLYNSAFYFEGELGEFNNFNLPTENTFSLVLADTTIIETDVSTGDTTNRDDIGTPRSNQTIIKGGQFSTGNFRDKRYVYTNGWNSTAEGTLSFEFNYYLLQRGGMFRPDSLIDIVSDDQISTRIRPWDISADATQADPRVINTTQIVGEDASGVFPATTATFDSVETMISFARSANNLPVYATFNNGPGEYRMILGPEQTMQYDFAYGVGDVTTKTFNIPYHDVQIVNETNYMRPDGERGDSVIVNMALPMEHIELPVNVVGEFQDPENDEIGTEYPSPINLYENGIDPKTYVGNYNITSYGFHDVRTKSVNPLFIARKFVLPGDPELAESINNSYTGLQGKYLKSAVSTDGQDTIDFVNMINIAGVNFYSDYANIGRFQVGNEQFRRPIAQTRDTILKTEFDPNAPNQVYSSVTEDETGTYYIVQGLKVFGNDLSENDEIVFKTKGGVLGLPYDSATVTYVVRGGDPGDDPMAPSGYTDNMLEEVNVVPNPYYLTHQAQRSPYDAKIYFNKLPPICTIEIYTATGDLVRKLEHNEYSAEANRESVEVWDLLTDSGLRVQSQSLVARIYTPDGAETLKTFSLVVGSFRIVQD